jgi:hypothetical protein
VCGLVDAPRRGVGTASGLGGRGDLAPAGVGIRRPMARRFVVAPEVEKLPGPQGVEQLTSAEVLACRCGQRARTDGRAGQCVRGDGPGRGRATDVLSCARARVLPAVAGRVRRPRYWSGSCWPRPPAPRGDTRPGVLPHPGLGDPAPVLTWSPVVRAMTAPGLRRTRSSTQGRSRSAPGSCSWRIAGATQGSCPRPQRPQTRLQMRGQRQIESTATAFEEAGRAEQLV